jgi:hypothetical protein
MVRVEEGVEGRREVDGERKLKMKVYENCVKAALVCVSKLNQETNIRGGDRLCACYCLGRAKHQVKADCYHATVQPSFVSKIDLQNES